MGSGQTPCRSTKRVITWRVEAIADQDEAARARSGAEEVDAGEICVTLRGGVWLNCRKRNSIPKRRGPC